MLWSRSCLVRRIWCGAGTGRRPLRQRLPLVLRKEVNMKKDAAVPMQIQQLMCRVRQETMAVRALYKLRRFVMLCALLQFGGTSLVLAQPMSDIPLSPWFYVSGGIGADSQADMRARRGDYGLRLTFAERGTGAYVTGVAVTIQRIGARESIGPLVDVGPLLYVRLQPGGYRVTANYQNTEKVWVVHIGRKPVEQVVYWPAS